MDPFSPLPALVVVLAAVATAAAIEKVLGAPEEEGRYVAIDGLRGYLAFFVFVHHSAVWYNYVRLGSWKVPPSALYTQLGQSSVALFFMITGFLFYSKILYGKNRRTDWLRLYVSRVFRLVPLYAVAMILLLGTVGYLSGWTLREPSGQVIGASMRWIAFSVLGRPDINAIVDTSAIVAGVTWTLPYEWFFYLSLPLLALTTRVMPPAPYVALAVASTVVAVVWRPAGYPVLSFVSGIAAAVLVRREEARSFATTRLASLLACACLIAVYGFFPTLFKPLPFVLLSIAFCLVACGTTLFGALAHPYSRTLGSMAYSIYLLHGFCLFILFRLVLGSRAAHLSPVQHWAVVLIATPVLVGISYATFRCVESTGIRAGPRFLAWMRSLPVGRPAVLIDSDDNAVVRR